MEREKSLSKVKIIPQIYEGPRGRNGKARLACRTCLSDVRRSTCVLVYFSWLLDHMIYLKLRTKVLCAKLSEFTKWHPK